MTTREEFIRLGWCLLERKCAYYSPGDGIPEPPPDSEYDGHERRYRKLARRLGEKPTADCVGFPDDRPSGRVVVRKLEIRGFLPWPRRAKKRGAGKTVKDPVRRSIPRKSLNTPTRIKPLF